ncbi:cathepsin L-like proteinase [Stegodyphus dumicola]|uniref:cathepsin L-like proteinase n=1 Tax=Stegodyphus dumicola TaxID=202533 RepID=UPI0015AD036E|nr:cathepsin L-like proteinase [Stegodyphus dumicola]
MLARELSEDATKYEYMIRIALILAYFTTTLAASFQPDYDKLWETYKDVFKKKYNSYEEPIRRFIWEANVAKIQLHNLEADLKKYDFKLGISNFTDLAAKEFNIRNGLKISNQTKVLSYFVEPSHVRYPTAVDWRKEGLVTEVKDQ